MRTPTAAIVIIGSEVLSAKVEDENGPYAARRLRAEGVELTAIATIPDSLAMVEETVARERARVDWVFTSGGIGPTHDDLTLAGVARALGRPLVRHPRLVENIERWHARRGVAPLEAALRMADVPEGTVLSGDLAHPVLVVENVVVLPGVPSFFRAQLDRFVTTLTAPPFRLACLFLSLPEDVFAEALDRIAREHADVGVGSYPRFDDTDHLVKITFEAKDARRVEAALASFLEALPAGSVVRREGP